MIYDFEIFGIILAYYEKRDMKTKITIVIFLAMLTTLYGEEDSVVSGGKISFFRKIFCKLDWKEVQQTVSSPREAAGVVRRNIHYQEDIGDAWTSAEETWQRGYGDCEDMAIAIADLVKMIGGDASVAVIYNSKKGIGHAIAYGKWDNEFWIASNGFYYKVNSLEDAAQIVKREMRWKDGEITIETLGNSRQSEMIVASKNRTTLPVYQKE